MTALFNGTKVWFVGGIALAAVLPLLALADSTGTEPAAGHEQSGRSVEFEITRWVIAGGGLLASAGGQWNLSGTIGQYDATPPRALSGGGWALTGGFWAADFEAPPTIDQLFSDRFELLVPQQ